jgi:hypothetical protein
MPYNSSLGPNTIITIYIGIISPFTKDYKRSVRYTSNRVRGLRPLGAINRCRLYCELRYGINYAVNNIVLSVGK